MKKILVILLGVLLLCGCSEKALSQEEFFDIYNKIEYFQDDEGNMLYFYGDDAVYVGIRDTEYLVEAKVNHFEYKKGTYLIDATVPAFAGNEMTEGYDAYPISFSFIVDPSNPNLIHAEYNHVSSNFKAMDESFDYEVCVYGDDLYLGLGHHVRAEFFGKPIDLFPEGYTYKIFATANGKPIEVCQFNTGNENLIYSYDCAAHFTLYRRVNCYLFVSDIATQVNGFYVTVTDLDGKVLKEFSDVWFCFDAENPNAFAIAKYNGPMDEAPKMQYFLITDKGLQEQ